jgi:hypothetical protein
MAKSEWVVLWLSLQLAVTTGLWVRAERRASYAEGQLAVLNSFDQAVNDAIGYPESQPKEHTHKYEGQHSVGGHYAK